MPAPTMPTNGSRHSSLTQTYQERASVSGTSALASYFLRLIAAKKTNLCVSADVSTTRELLQIAEEVGDHICLLKTHADIIHDFGGKTFQDLQAIAKRKGFLIFEDRKFGDIGNTVQLQYTSGPLQIVRWANIVNAHIFPGPAIVTALANAADDAVTAYNTSVETQITGPELPDGEGEAEPEEAEDGLQTPEPEEQDGDRLSSDEEDDDESEDEPVTYSDDDQVGDLARTTSRRLSSPSEMERKFSVVSVSTTISTKTEHISPQPTPVHHRGFSEGLNYLAASEQVDPQKALQNLGEPPMARGLLLLAQMSSAGNLMDESYASKCVDAARLRPDFVLGFIAQRSLNSQPGDNFITMTPGVQIGAKGDELGQQYNTPEAVIGAAGSDVIIVGRGIYGAQDRRQAAAEYRDRAWRAYEERVGLGRA
ncbi:Orotidine 5'-phosphate decarboxylase [Myriangium duriaei CBS 260.36]|uniref:Orotidine 5'-phosphate decarboxylase n=1 Tax=Myriangium duriaei CBS 260.36 TaxID=1168546 RepID=A0A9P4MF19_9PEZI|nr:Orotidine 5'-phosphate decarboxylase [Myriangium duriaei CBS 260.36]